MTDQAIMTPVNLSEKIENVVIGGDLSKLSPDERLQYYKAVCQSVGLNPLTRPFDYIVLNKKLTLYARKDATDQLRRNNNISIVGKPEIQFEGDFIIVTVEVRDEFGRTDADVGAVNKNDMRGDFGNALMKAVTKAKRRATLSICGLGMLDETEVETIPDAQYIDANAVEVTPPKMSLATALDTTTSDGKVYGELEVEELAHRYNSIAKKLKDNDLTPEDREQYQFKMDAAKVIMDHRAAQDK